MVTVGTRCRGFRVRGHGMRVESNSQPNQDYELNKRYASLIEELFVYFVDTVSIRL